MAATRHRNPPPCPGCMWKSLNGYVCPKCRGDLKLNVDGTNVCQGCGLELVTEWEWNRRQRQASEDAEQRFRFEEALARSVAEGGEDQYDLVLATESSMCDSCGQTHHPDDECE